MQKPEPAGSLCADVDYGLQGSHFARIWLDFD